MYAAGMTIMAVSVGEICENTKLAREMALMGNYDSAMVYYEGTVQMIHRLLTTIADPTRKSKWQLVSALRITKYVLVHNSVLFKLFTLNRTFPYKRRSN